MTSSPIHSPLAPHAPDRQDVLAGRTVLQIIPSLDTGGAERTTLDIAAALAAAGARPLVASEGGRLIPELQALGGIWIPFPASRKTPLAIWRNARLLAELIRREHIDLVHARSRAPAWSARIATKRGNIPFVTTYHGAYGGHNRWKRRYNSVMAMGDVVIANSRYTAGVITASWPDAAERVAVIARGTDLAAFSPGAVSVERVNALRQAWEIPPYHRIVLLAGRLTPWKGQRILIEAAALLKSRGLSDVVFILAGDAQGREAYVADLDRRIASKSLAGIVKRVGHCADMPAAYLAAATAVIPSIEPEAFGRTAVEAQAVGCPVIVSDHGATPETVLAPPEAAESERTGWRVPAGDAKALADAIEAVLDLGASARDALALRARAHVESKFSLNRMCEATLNLYRHLMRPGP